MRSADAVSNYLWSRGHRYVDASIISHPDLSHCNALPGILARFDVEQVVLSNEFLADDHPATFAILDRIDDQSVRVNYSNNTYANVAMRDDTPVLLGNENLSPGQAVRPLAAEGPAVAGD